MRGQESVSQKRWATWQIVLLVLAGVTTLLFGFAGGLRDLAAAVIIVALVGLAVVIMGKRAGSTRAITVLLVGAIVIAPWLLGITANSLHGWTDHVVYWGRLYNLDRTAPDAELIASEHPMSAVQFAVGSTWLPDPLVAVDVHFAPAGLIVRLPSGRFVGYSLVGGP